MLEWLSDLALYLNANGFQINAYQIIILLEILHEQSELSVEDLIEYSAQTFAQNQNQYLKFSELLVSWLEIRQAQKNCKGLEKELEEKQNALLDLQTDLSEQIKSLEQEKQRSLEELQSHTQIILRDQTRVRLQNLLNSFQNQTLSDEEKSLLEAAESLRSPESVYHERQMLQQSFLKIMEEAIWDEDTAGFIRSKAFLESLKSLVQDVSGKMEERTKLQARLNHEFSLKEKQLEREASRQMQQVEKQTDFLSGKIEKLKVKTVSHSHRPVFIGGQSVWKSSADGDLNELDLTMSLKSLNQKQTALFYQAVKNNAAAFRTRLIRSLQSGRRISVNLKKTIQHACKTGGVPLMLQYQKENKRKARLLLLLDISGSCSHASRVMILLFHCLKDVFKNGCQTFAFVNSLYDVSEIMETPDPNTAMETLFKIIPVKGVYSDYGTPIHTLAREYRRLLTKDTTVIVVGDGRGNKRDPSIEDFANICRRSGHVYWLNTDKPEKFGQGDSDMPLYAEFAQMSYIRNIQDVLLFLQSMR